jgi:hypothetical protein
VSRSYRGISDSQANADALARRAVPYGVPSDASFRRAWDHRNREPSDLREAEHYVRRAYADEVPGKLHEGPDSIGPDGTPRMTARAEGYIFGSPQASDARRGPCAGEATCREFQPHRSDCPLVWAGVDPSPELGYPWLTERGASRLACSCRWVHYDACPANPQNRQAVSYFNAPFRAALDNLAHGDEAERKRGAIVAHVAIGGQGSAEAAIKEGVPWWCAKLVAEDALRSFLRNLTDVRIDLRRAGQEAVVA